MGEEVHRREDLYRMGRRMNQAGVGLREQCGILSPENIKRYADMARQWADELDRIAEKYNGVEEG